MSSNKSLPFAMADKITEMQQEIIPQYKSIIPLAPMTALTVRLMEAEVAEAVKALASGDTIRMLRAWEAIKDYKQ